MSAPEVAVEKNRFGWQTLVWAALGAFYFVGPAQPMPTNTLDGSWTYGINYALTHGLKFGTDLVFTMGPLGAFFTNSYDPAIQPWWIAFHLLFAGALALLWSDGCGNRPAPWRVVLLGLVLLTTVRGDRQFLLLFSSALLVCVWRPGTLTSLVVTGIGLGLASLCKFTFVLTAVVVVGAIAARGLLTRRRIDFVAPAVFLVTAAIGWAALGYSPGQVAAYAQTSLEISRGYALAMGSHPGPPSEIVLFWIAGSLAVVFLWTSFSEPNRGVLLQSLAAVATLAFLFLVYKAGFTRHDGHALIASGTIGAFALVALAIFAPTGRRVPVGLAATAAACLAMGTTSWHYDESMSAQLLGPWRRLAAERSEHAAWEIAVAQIRAEARLPAIAGSVDIYSRNQAVVIANGLEWRPRPVFQSYAAYTANLAGLNTRHLEERGAGTLLFAYEPIDDRLPGLEDGASMIPLMRWYQPAPSIGRWLQLRRNATPRDVKLLNPRVERVRINEEWLLPTDASPVWLKIRASPGLQCRIQALVTPPPLLRIAARLANGEVREFRFIPGMAEAGFLASPLIEDTLSLEAFFTSASAELLAHRRVVGLTIKGGPSAQRCNVEGFALEVATVQWTAPVAVTLTQVADEALPVPTQLNDATLEVLPEGYAISASGNDPIAVLGSLKPVADNCERTLYVDLEVPTPDEAMVFWRAGDLPFSGDHSARFPIAGRGVITLPLAKSDLPQELRLDPGTRPGRFIVHRAHVITKDKSSGALGGKPCN